MGGLGWLGKSLAVSFLEMLQAAKLWLIRRALISPGYSFLFS